MTLLDYLYPRRCVNCRSFGDYLCQNCLRRIKPAFDVCPACERPAMLGETHRFCSTPLSLDGLTSAFVYGGAIKQAIHRLKYKPYLKDLAEKLSALLNNSLIKNKGFAYFLKNNPIIVPIPLHWWREHLRGYNQTQLIAENISRKFHLPISQILVRIKKTKPQSGLKFKDRLKNVQGIFQIKPNIKLPDSIILVDDIWTTGSTLKSACKVLKRKGVKNVWAVTLAR